jgi:hypothetical protein
VGEAETSDSPMAYQQPLGTTAQSRTGSVLAGGDSFRSVQTATTDLRPGPTSGQSAIVERALASAPGRTYLMRQPALEPLPPAPPDPELIASSPIRGQIPRGIGNSPGRAAEPDEESGTQVGRVGSRLVEAPARSTAGPSWGAMVARIPVDVPRPLAVAPTDFPGERANVESFPRRYPPDELNPRDERGGLDRSESGFAESPVARPRQLLARSTARFEPSSERVVSGQPVRGPFVTSGSGPVQRTPLARRRMRLAETVSTLALAAASTDSSGSDEAARPPTARPAPVDVLAAWPELPRLTLARRAIDPPDDASSPTWPVDGSGTLIPAHSSPTSANLPPALPVARDARSNGPPARSVTVQRAVADPSTTTTPPPVFTGGPATVTSSSPTAGQSGASDLDALARQVLTLVKKRLAVERERLGPGRGLRNW